MRVHSTNMDYMYGYPMILILAGCVVISSAEFGVHSADSMSSEQKLVNFLLNHYKDAGKVARPVQDASHTINVQFGIRLLHLDLDEKEQVMKTSVWVRMKWNDQHLQWMPDDYNGITSIVLPVDNIWKPDIVLVNTAETTVKEQSADVMVKFNGQVFWAPQRKYSSACLIDVTEFPYDRHTCDMWFQSMTNPSDYVNITTYRKSPLDLDTYLTSYKDAQEWQVLSNISTRHDRPRDVGMILMWSRRASLRFTLTVQRRAGFKGMLLIVPCALLSFLVPIVFCFPPERPDRHTLAMSLFASLTILLFMVNEVAPPSAAFVPRLALYYSFNLLVLLLATCCSVAVVNLSKRGETRERVPKPVRLIVIKGFGKMLCLTKRLEHLTEVKRASRRMRNSGGGDSNTRHTYNEHTLENGTMDEGPSTTPEAYPLQFTAAPDHVERDAAETSHTNRIFAVLYRKLSSIEGRLNDQHAPKTNAMPDISIPVDVRMEWRTLSVVLDRFFFLMFLIIDIVSLGVFHPRMPY